MSTIGVRLLVGDSPLLNLVGLITDDDFVHPFSPIPTISHPLLVYLLLPETQGIERLFVSHVEYEHNTMGTLIVAGGDRPEAILSGRIPYLHLNLSAIQFDVLHFLL